MIRLLSQEAKVREFTVGANDGNYYVSPIKIINYIGNIVKKRYSTTEIK